MMNFRTDLSITDHHDALASDVTYLMASCNVIIELERSRASSGENLYVVRGTVREFERLVAVTKLRQH